MLNAIMSLFGYMPVSDHKRDLTSETAILNNIVSDHVATISNLTGELKRADAHIETMRNRAQIFGVYVVRYPKTVTVEIIGIKAGSVDTFSTVIRQGLSNNKNVAAYTAEAEALATALGLPGVKVVEK